MIDKADNPEDYFKAHEGEPFAWEARKKARGTWRALAESFAYLPPFNRIFGKITPSYAESYWYCLGGLTFLSFLFLLVTGLILALLGPTWWLKTHAGFVIKSMHYWSAEAFFFFLFLHIIRVWITGAYRGKRWWNYAIGFLILFMALGENFMGLLARGDWESQFVAMHSAGMLFTVPGLTAISPPDFTVVMLIHVAFVPFIIALLIGVHALLVKLQGIARPL